MVARNQLCGGQAGVDGVNRRRRERLHGAGDETGTPRVHRRVVEVLSLFARVLAAEAVERGQVGAVQDHAGGGVGQERREHQVGDEAPAFLLDHVHEHAHGGVGVEAVRRAADVGVFVGELAHVDKVVEARRAEELDGGAEIERLELRQQGTHACGGERHRLVAGAVVTHGRRGAAGGG